MLIEFSVANYRSFKDKVTFSMVAANIVAKDKHLNVIKISKTYKADGIQEKTRHNALFLSVSAQFNVKIAEQILAWLTNKLKIISGLRDDKHLIDTVQQCLAQDKNKEAILRLIRKLDLGIDEVEVQEREITSDILLDIFPDELKKFLVKSGGSATSIGTLHRKFDSQGHYTSMELFSLDEQESEGTKKVFALGGPLFETLSNGKVLVIDEFDARLYPLISRAIVDLFNSNETNPNNAQFIFMTHDTNLLSNKIFRRDQIWFTEKNRQGATDLYSLAEYNIRNDASEELNKFIP